MRKSYRFIWLVAVCMCIIVGREIWQLSHLFSEVKKDYTRMYGDAVEHALLRLAFVSNRQDEFIRYDAENEVLGYYSREEGLYRKTRVGKDQSLVWIVEGPLYDIRDTAKWTLRALNRGFQEYLFSSDEQCVPVVFTLKNSRGEEIDRYQSGVLRGKSPCLVSVPLGFASRDCLEVACDFTWQEFWKEAGSALTLLSALFVALVLCVVLLLRQYRQERRIAAFREMFARAFTHDLKAPISNVINGLYLLDAQLPPDFKAENGEVFSALRRQSVRIREAVDKLLAALVREHGLSLHREPVDMRDFLSRALESRTWEKYAGKPFDLRLDLQARRALVMGDKTFLEFAIQNVVENALKYSDPGVRVTVSVRDVGNVLRVSVEDNGWGIPAESLRRVFKPGYRVPRFADKVRGSGVGLSVIRQIVKAHRGTVAIESRLGAGTKVIVTLPLIPTKNGQ